MLLRLITLTCLISLATPILSARIILPSILSDHMVLQQKESVTIWGWSTQSNDEIRVWGSWAKDTVQVNVIGGRWQAQVQTPKAGGPFEVVILDRRGDRVVIEDVLIGEVWLASGQSNMEWTLQKSAEAEEEIPKANQPEIRLFKAERRSANTPQDDLLGEWVVCTPETAAQFSGVGYFFSQTLNQRLNLPIGCVMSCWGGTVAEAWTPADELAKDERVAAASEGIQGPSGPPRVPGILYNAMIYPLQNFRIKGVIWYQGESNRGRPKTYLPLMVRLIEGWRAKWGYEFPFYFVQIAPYDYSLRNSSGGPYIREAQLQTLSLPKTGMVVTADVGDFVDIHPKRKKPVGERLAYWALAKDYEMKKQAFSGPVYRRHRIEGNSIHLSFSYTDGGLTIKDDIIKEIYLAGEDRVFYPAQAEIKGEELVVSHPQINKPVAVRYGFSDTDQMNLFNGAGLPASSFRTDDWAHETVQVKWDYGLERSAVSSSELANWNFWGKGRVEQKGSQLLIEEAVPSSGVMLISPASYPGDVVIRYKVQAVTAATVIVTLLAASDEGESQTLELPTSYEGSISMWTKEKENYFFAFKNAPHDRTPFVRKQPNSEALLAKADENVMVAGQYYEIEVGKVKGKIWLSVDGKKLFQYVDETPLSGGHLAIRLRGTGGFPAACLIKEAEVLAK